MYIYLKVCGFDGGDCCSGTCVAGAGGECLEGTFDCRDESEPPEVCRCLSSLQMYLCFAGRSQFPPVYPSSSKHTLAR